MIVSTLEHTGSIELLHPRLKTVFDYVRSHDFSEMQPGRIVLDGDNVFINLEEKEGTDRDSRLLEVHRRYIDVHLPLSCSETIGWLPSGNLKKVEKAYEKEADIAFYSDKPSIFVDIVPGEFFMAFPEDAHAPLIGSGKIRKLIAKVRI